MPKDSPPAGILAKLKGLFFKGPKAEDKPEISHEDLPTVQADSTMATLVVSNMSAIQDAYNKAIRIEMGRRARYEDYEVMLTDPIARSAMELMADDAAQPNRETGRTVWVTGEKEYEKDGNEILERLSIGEVLNDWGLWVSVYGDFFVNLQGQKTDGVTVLSDAFHPWLVKRVDLDGELRGFSCEELNKKHLLPPWEFLHLRTQRYRETMGELKDRNSLINVMAGDTGKKEYRNTTTYGLSALEAARKVFKQLKLVEDTIIMARVVRAPVTNIVAVNVGKLPPDKMAAYVKLVERRLRRKMALDLNANTLDSSFRLPSQVETAVLPVRGDGKGELRIEQLGGDVDIHGIKDLEYLQRNYFGALRVPAAYLGHSEDLPGSLGESALYRLEIRYARMVKKIQLSIVRAIMRLIQIDRAWRGKETDVTKFKVELNFVSSAEEEELKAALDSGVSAADGLLRLLRDLDVKADPEKFWRFLDASFFHLGVPFEDLIKTAEGEERPRTIGYAKRVLEWSDMKARVPFFGRGQKPLPLIRLDELKGVA